MTRQAAAQATTDLQAEVTSFLSSLEAGGASTANVRAHQQALGRFAEFLAPRALRGARPADAETFAAYLTELGVSPASLTVYRTVLRRWFEAAPSPRPSETSVDATPSAPSALVGAELAALAGAAAAEPLAATPGWQALDAAPAPATTAGPACATTGAPATETWSAVSSDATPSAWFAGEPPSEAGVTRVDPEPEPSVVAVASAPSSPSLSGWSLGAGGFGAEDEEEGGGANVDFATIATPVFAPPPMPRPARAEVVDEAPRARTDAVTPAEPPPTPYVRPMNDTRGRAALSNLAAPYNGGEPPADGIALAPADEEVTWLENAAAEATAGRGQHDHMSQSAALPAAPPPREASRRRSVDEPAHESWSVRRGGEVVDDLSLATVRSLARRGELTAADFIRKGDAPWTRVTDFAPLRSAIAPSPVDRAAAVLRAQAAGAALAASIAAVGAGAVAWTTLIVAQRDFPLAWAFSGAACGLLVRLMAHPSRPAGVMSALGAVVAAALSTYMLFMTATSGVATEGFGSTSSLAAFVMARMTGSAVACVLAGCLAAFGIAAAARRRPAR